MKETIKEEVKVMGEEIRRMKAEKADPELIKEKVNRMLEKKKLLGEEVVGKYSLKCPKGTRDYGPKSMAVREKVLKTVTNCFKKYGAETIETPVFELKDTLLGKYGEEGGKLVFDLADQGGELLSLRYDLTVPFARYLAMNKITNMTRYQIAKVYRRDQPALTRGRYREFYQCDYDIAGHFDKMLPEAEILKIVDEILSSLRLGDFVIKLNHRLLLNGIFEICGVANSQFKTVCSSIDKLDKCSWQDVENELLNDKNIPSDTVHRLEHYVRCREKSPLCSNEQLIVTLENNPELMANEQTRKALLELRLLLSYAEMYRIQSRITIDPSLARGLDYYTGVIFEAIVKDFTRNSNCTDESLNVGSVAAGGRYDSLVGMFSTKKQDVPCVGVSFGIERLLSIIETRVQCQVRTIETEVFVASAQKNLLNHRMDLCNQLWDADIKAKISYKENPKMLDQMQYCEYQKIPLAVIIGERELNEGVVKLRIVSDRTEEDIPKNDLVQRVREKLLTLRIIDAKMHLNEQ